MFNKIKNLMLKNKIFYSLYLKKKLYLKNYKKFFYSEFGEDIFVERFFNKKKFGKYIDIGCYHPIKSSLTYNLFKKGWSGINIDLSKQSIDLFKADRPNDINLFCAVSNINEKINFYETSPINQQNSLIKSSQEQKEKLIDSYTLDSLQKKYNFYDVNYINIDTEGSELNVLHGINFKLTHPDLISLEDNSFSFQNIQKIKKIDYMSSNGYELINFIGVTMFFCRKDLMNKIFEFISVD